MQIFEISYGKHEMYFMKVSFHVSPLPSGLVLMNTNATIKKTSPKKTYKHEKIE